MGKIDNIFLKTLAKKELEALRRMIIEKGNYPEEYESKEILSRELANVYKDDKELDLESISLLGLENCCMLFHEFCRYYSGDLDGDIQPLYVKFMGLNDDKELHIGGTEINYKVLKEAVKEEIDEMYYASIKNVRNAGGSTLYKRIEYNAFANLYNTLADYVIGNNYPDLISNRVRRVPEDRKTASEELLKASLPRDEQGNLSDLRDKLTKMLLESVEYIYKTPVELPDEKKDNRGSKK